MKYVSYTSVFGSVCKSVLNLILVTVSVLWGFSEIHGWNMKGNQERNKYIQQTTYFMLTFSSSDNLYIAGKSIHILQ